MDDPQAAPSWSGVMLQPDQVARRAVELLDDAVPVVSMPRWRGGVARAFSLTPRLAVRVVPAMIADARRKQKRWARKHASGGRQT